MREEIPDSERLRNLKTATNRLRIQNRELEFRCDRYRQEILDLTRKNNLLEERLKAAHDLLAELEWRRLDDLG